MQKFLACKIRLGWQRHALFAIYFLPSATKSNKIEPWEWKLSKEAQWTIVDPRSDSNLQPFRLSKSTCAKTRSTVQSVENSRKQCWHESRNRDRWWSVLLRHLHPFQFEILSRAVKLHPEKFTHMNMTNSNYLQTCLLKSNCVGSRFELRETKASIQSSQIPQLRNAAERKFRFN